MENSATPNQKPSRPRRSIFFRLCQIGLFALFCLVTCVVLFYAIENWRGRHALRRYQAELEGKGEHLGWQAIIPPPVPEDRNLAMTPLLKPLLDYERVNGRPVWRSSSEDAKAFNVLGQGPHISGPDKPKLIDLEGWARLFGNENSASQAEGKSVVSNVLAGLAQFDPQFAELKKAVRSRPEARWPVRYDENFACLLPHLAVVKNIVIGCMVRAAADLEDRNPAAAFEDVTIGFALSDSLKTDPILITHLVREAITSFNVQAVREGLARRNWSDEQLLDFQNRFAAMNLFAELKRCLRGERAFSTDAIDMMRQRKLGSDFWSSAGNNAPRWATGPFFAMAPRGWLERNVLNILRFHDEYSLAVVDENALRIDPTRGVEMERSLTNSTTPYNVLSRLLLPAVSSVLPKTARAQSIVQQTAIACALERYYRAHQQYPAQLQELVPQFMARVPHDVMDGAPMRYRRGSDKSYLLYSIGWNLTDDGGTVLRTGKNQAVSSNEGDWVWRLFPVQAGSE